MIVMILVTKNDVYNVPGISDRLFGYYLFGAGDSKTLEELATDYFIRASGDEEEFSADEDSETESGAEPAVLSLRVCHCCISVVSDRLRMVKQAMSE